MIFNKVLYLGDSLLNGARDGERSVPFEVTRLIKTETGVIQVPIVDCVNGRTTSDLLKIAWKYCDPEIRDAVVMIGTNDSRIPLSLLDYAINLSLILDILKAQNKRHIYLCKIPEPKGFGSSGYSKENTERISEYNSVISTYKDKGIIVVEIEGLERADYVDGIHFAKTGRIKVAGQIRDAIYDRREF